MQENSKADPELRPHPVAPDFHKHLDECQQCRDHPFALCPVGAKLLVEMK